MTPAAALRLHGLGLCVIPLRPREKVPAIEWKAYQTTRPTETEVEKWFRDDPSLNAGIVCGAVSGIAVVDTDTVEAEEWAEAHELSTPAMTRTARGLHRVFLRPTALPEIPRFINTGTGLKIEVRCDGQYVVAPGSVHPSGHVYAEVEPWPETFDDLPTLPMDVVLGHAPRKKSGPPPRLVTEGNRNDLLFREGCRLRRLGWSATEIEKALLVLNAERCRKPLDEKEVGAIARSSARYDAEDAPGDGTWVVMRGGDLTPIVDRAEAALLGGAIYQRGGLLTRAIKLDTAIGERAVRREAGSTVLIAVREPWLLEQMGLKLRWRKAGARGETSPADPQPIYARTLLNRGEWRFPVLRGVVTAPTLARDGRVIEAPGFDAASGLLLDIAPGAFPPMPPNATKDDAMAALARLSAPLRGFPFVDDAAESVALSALLTALIRVSLRTAPLHGFDAPTAGSGKSLLAEMAGLLATGFRPPALSQGKSDEEDEKRLSTILFAGDPVIHIDNCERPIGGDFLCSMLTQEIVQARILGLSERRVLPSTALVLASGNNLTLAGDASRRAVVCRLDAKVERPDTRAFDFDCHQEVLASRPELVVAGLTILHAYHAAGRTERLMPMGSFTDWEWVRGALVWLGCADPADTRSSILENDPRKDELVTVMDLWEQVLGSDPVTVAFVGLVGRRAKPEDPATPADALRAKLIEVSCRGSWNGKSVGWWLRRHKDRVVGDRCFRSEPGEGRRWWLAREGGRGMEGGGADGHGGEGVLF